jgi:hypothetical protein
MAGFEVTPEGITKVASLHVTARAACFLYRARWSARLIEVDRRARRHGGQYTFPLAWAVVCTFAPHREQRAMTGRVSSHVQSLLGYLGLVLLRWGELGDGPLRILCNASSALIAAVNAACSARSASNSLGRTALFISGYPILNCTLSLHYRTCQSQQYPHLRVVWGGGTGDRDIFCVAQARWSEVSNLATTAKNNC